MSQTSLSPMRQGPLVLKYSGTGTYTSYFQNKQDFQVAFLIPGTFSLDVAGLLFTEPYSKVRNKNRVFWNHRFSKKFLGQIFLALPPYILEYILLRASCPPFFISITSRFGKRQNKTVNWYPSWVTQPVGFTGSIRPVRIIAYESKP